MKNLFVVMIQRKLLEKSKVFSRVVKVNVLALSSSIFYKTPNLLVKFPTFWLSRQSFEFVKIFNNKVSHFFIVREASKKRYSGRT